MGITSAPDLSDYSTQVLDPVACLFRAFTIIAVSSISFLFPYMGRRYFQIPLLVKLALTGLLASCPAGTTDP
jgi:hypothetical protein